MVGDWWGNGKDGELPIADWQLPIKGEISLLILYYLSDL
jgi:hypothetical protein